MKVRVAGVAAALAVGLAGQAQAQTPPLTQCGGAFTGEKTCSFEYGGGSIYVSLGLATDPLGLAAVRLEAEASSPIAKRRSRRARRTRSAPVRRLLLTCDAFGVYGVCAAAQSGDGDLMAIGTPLHCTVTGRTSVPGRFRCGSQSDAQTGTSGEIHP